MPQRSAALTDKIIIRSSALSRSSARPNADVRVPLSVNDKFEHLQGTELKVLLVLCREQGRGGARR